MDLFIKGGTVVTMDAEFRVIEDGAVAIEGDSHRGGRQAHRSRIHLWHSSEDDRRKPVALVLPGMINGHAHAAMSLVPRRRRGSFAR